MLLLDSVLTLFALMILHGMNQPWQLHRDRENGQVSVKLELYGYQCRITLSKWKATLKTHYPKT